jgi:TnpA family transposase
VPANAPCGFVRPKWQPHVFPPDGGIDRCYYELCVLTELRNGLRSGDVWVEGSRRYADFEGYLLPKDVWAGIRSRGAVTVDVNPNFAEFLSERKQSLDEQLRRVSELAERNELPEARLGDGRLHFSPLPRSTPEEAEQWAERAYDLLPRIKLTDLFVEVDGWTKFTDCFTHLHSGNPAKSKDVLLAGIMADATNQGTTKMAEACPGLSYEKLCWTADWHIREETYAKALAEIVNLQHRLPMAEQWGDGSTSSSDGQAFPIAMRRPVIAQTNAKYGRDPVVTFYTHISDRYAPFHTKAISSTVRDAPHVLDGLLGHDTDLRIREHYTDTAGFTDQVFAACTLLGFRFAPRIRDLGDQRIYTLDRPKQYPTLLPLIGGRIQARKIEQSWDEILRLASSIRMGTVTASLILGKLASYPRQNGLAQALRELGRIERTLFTLDWIRNPDLRQRATIGLNKGEARNTLARAVFFHRRGAVRDRLREDLQNKASGLNLAVAAIILWNTVYLQKAVQMLADEGTPVPPECMPHLSPLGWEHINMTGDYLWSLQRVTTLEKLRPLRRHRLLSKEALPYSQTAAGGSSRP